MIEMYVGDFDGKDLNCAIQRGREIADPKRLYIDFDSNKKGIQFVVRKHIGDSVINVVVHQVDVNKNDIEEMEEEDLVPQINGHNFCVNIEKYEERASFYGGIMGYRGCENVLGSCVSCGY